MLSIRVHNYLGVIQKTIDISNTNEGINKLEINASNLPAGIYFYSLIINGKVSDTKKMVVVKQ